MRLLDELLQEALETSSESLGLSGVFGESGGRDIELYPELFPEFGVGETENVELFPELLPEIDQRPANEFELETPRLEQIVVTPKPNISDLIDYLDATVVARGRVTVPTEKINFLVELDPPDKATWWKQLWQDPLKVVPKVRVTVELVQVGASLFPFSKDATGGVLVRQGINEYLMKLYSASCSGFATALGGGFLITTRAAIEKELGIDGQLDALLRRANIKLPMSAADQQKHFWIVYATFPSEIRSYLIPEDRVVLDEFEFDKSVLTQTHIGKIIAIARYLAPVAKFTAPATPLKVGL